VKNIFISKIKNIINIDKYIFILDEIKDVKDGFGGKLTRPLTGLGLPWMNNKKNERRLSKS